VGHLSCRGGARLQASESFLVGRFGVGVALGQEGGVEYLAQGRILRNVQPALRAFVCGDDVVDTACLTLLPPSPSDLDPRRVRHGTRLLKARTGFETVAGHLVASVPLAPAANPGWVRDHGRFWSAPSSLANLGAGGIRPSPVLGHAAVLRPVPDNERLGRQRAATSRCPARRTPTSASRSAHWSAEPM
jgi:hypothetical protein